MEFANGAVRSQLAEEKQRQAAIVENWRRTTLLEGLGENSPKEILIAQLLENQANYMAMLKEETSTGDIATFDNVAFPMVRRIFGKLLASEIVSVQALSLPSGLLFYLDVLANTTNARTTYTSVYDGLYDYDKVDRSMGPYATVSGASVAATPWVGGALSDEVTTTSTAATVGYSGGYQGLSKLKLVTTALTEVPMGAWTIAPDTWGMDMLGSGMTNRIQVRFPAGAGGAIAGKTRLSLVWRQYDQMQTPRTSAVGVAGPITAMTEIKLVISSTSVNVSTRKMKAHWTPELAQDINAYHGINAEAELTALLSEEVTAEIDREILADLFKGAAFRTSWNYNRNELGTASGFTTQRDWNQTLITKVNEISAAMNKATLRGGANWIVASSEICAVFDDLEAWHAIGDAQDETFSMGMERVGTISGRYKVYRDPYLPHDLMLIGHKGSNIFETGYVYAPYIPLQLTDIIYDPDDFTPRRGIMTRYGKKMVNNKYYGVIRVESLNTYPRT